MKLYLIQHGEAVDKEVDSSRPLTAHGRETVSRVARFAGQAGVSVSAVWHSGKTRATQTAQSVAEHIASAEPIEHDGLKPNDDVKAIVRELNKFDHDLAIVGHMPHLSRLAGRLILDDEKHDILLFQRGGIVALERDADGVWRLIWVLTPDLIRPT
jgi:phosphohistidine phosphatase